MRHRRLRFALALASLMTGTVLGTSSAIGSTPLPAHLYAPYFEMWTTDSMSTVAQASGAPAERRR